MARGNLGLLVLSLLTLYASTDGFRLVATSLAWRNNHMLIYMSGYVSPERDPLYRDMVKKSLLPTDTELQTNNLLPIPKEGDIVQYPGKWPGELSLGRVRFIRYTEKESWVADIVPLKEGKSEGVFVVDRSMGTLFEPVDKIYPVRSFFLRNENGYKIAFRKNSTEVILRAPSYQTLDSSYLPPTKKFNMDILQDDLKQYQQLKSRIILNAVKFAAVGAVISQFAFGSEVSGPYLLGGGAGALYLYLLGKKTDRIGASYAIESSQGAQGKLDDTLAKARFAVPLMMVLILGAKSVVVDGREWAPLNIVSRENFLGAVAGFLTYRISLFATEVATELRTEDLLGAVPGSFAEAYRLSKGMKEKKDADASIEAGKGALVPVVFITGPKAAGRSSLAQRIKLSGSKKTINFVKYLTTDPLSWRSNPEKYELIEKKELEDLRQNGGLVYEGEEQSSFGSATPIALAFKQFTSVQADVKAAKLAYIVEGQPQVLEALSKVPAFQLLNIWISLQTKEQFINKATQIVQNELLTEIKQGKEKGTLAAKSAQAVSDLVNNAARDITFYMSKAPLFEYTLLNNSEDETLDELEQLLTNSL